MSESENAPARERRTLIEEGTEFKGTMSSTCPIDVMGRVEGEVSGPSIHISETGAVAGTIKVTHLRSEGELSGEVAAETVQLSGRVKDGTSIRASSLEVRLNVPGGAMEVVFGEVELAVGDAPSKQAAIDAAVGPAVAETPAVIEPTPVAEVPAVAETGAVAAAVEGGATGKTVADWEVAGEERPKPEKRGGRRSQPTQPPPS
jgi:cytoskeletal protein CcmA (bactofilin family)